MLESKDPRFEFINYHGNTSLFALDVLRRHGTLAKMKLLSLACLMPHLADYLALFDTVHHNTLVETHLPAPENCYPAKLHIHQRDLFELAPMPIDCVISHAAIHCFNDTRYGNVNTSTGWEKPYRVAGKLREIAGRAVPTIVSIAVNREEGFIDNNAHLAHDKFIASFEAAGFALCEYFFDYVCGGIPQQPQYLDWAYRRSKKLPETCASPKHWVVGNYYFA